MFQLGDLIRVAGCVALVVVPVVPVPAAEPIATAVRFVGNHTVKGTDYALVTVWTQPDGGGVWATNAAVELYNDGLFDDPTAAQIALVSYGDAYVNNSYACGGGKEWTAKASIPNGTA